MCLLGTFVGSLNSSQNNEALSHVFTGAHVGSCELEVETKSRRGSGSSQNRSEVCGCGAGAHWKAEGVEIRTSWNPGRARLLLSACQAKSDNSRKSPRRSTEGRKKGYEQIYFCFSTFVNT